jgi:hypothetical protein
MAKTIKIGNNEYKMEGEYRRRTVEALNDTREKLAKELSYSKDLQHKDMVEFYNNHIAKLESWLA